MPIINYFPFGNHSCEFDHARARQPQSSASFYLARANICAHCSNDNIVIHIHMHSRSAQTYKHTCGSTEHKTAIPIPSSGYEASPNRTQFFHVCKTRAKRTTERDSILQFPNARSRAAISCNITENTRAWLARHHCVPLLWHDVMVLLNSIWFCVRRRRTSPF